MEVTKSVSQRFGRIRRLSQPPEHSSSQRTDQVELEEELKRAPAHELLTALNHYIFDKMYILADDNTSQSEYEYKVICKYAVIQILAYK